MDENGDGLCDLPNVKKQESIKSSTQTPQPSLNGWWKFWEEEIVVEAQVEEVVVHPKK